MLNSRKKNKIIIKILFVFFVFCVFSNCYYINFISPKSSKFFKQTTKIVTEFPQNSALIGVINLTNYEINHTRHYLNSIVPIKGKVYEPFPSPPPYNNIVNLDVAIMVDWMLDTNFNATTNSLGEFQIDYRIPYTMDIYTDHIIQVVAITDLGIDDILPINYFIISAKTTSNIECNIYNIPYIPGEGLLISGYLKYYDAYGDGIPNAQITYYWDNGTHLWPSNLFFTNPSDGSFSQIIQIPNDIFSNFIHLRFEYPGNPPYVNFTSKSIENIKIFRDVNWNWNIIDQATEGDDISIMGQLLAKNDPTLKIFNRTINIIYDNNLIGSVLTDSEGNFSYNYIIPTGPGNKSLTIELVESVGGIRLFTTKFLIISAYTVSPPSNTQIPPFLIFSSIFFPILAVIIGLLLGYGFYYYKKQDKESKVVKLPLEDKIINLKILKNSGRLEESISYLFNAIYMGLINAKYGRIRKDTETIRDFAIISVKNLKLTPTAIYPFIQKVEEIIYAKPFQITEKEFYSTIGLFSPIYFELTGYNFILNF